SQCWDLAGIMNSIQLAQSWIPQETVIFASDAVVDVYTVEQLKRKSSPETCPESCATDGFIVNEASNTCTFCSDVSPEAKSTFASFDILVDVTDHTGTLHSCYLSDTVAEETLGCTVDEFLMLEEDQKTALKWQLLLERSKIYFKVTSSPNWRTGLKVNLLSCKLADPMEASQSLLGRDWNY
uniref:Uncharacterized protein n=1 Tax=Taeniopygia guttata TaxID=59729 RepID=A0A674GP39_TAEGU